MKTTFLKAFAVTAALGMAIPAMAAEKTFIAIGTGGVTGVYYPTGGAVCRMLNQDRRRHRIRCGVESTDGSIANLLALRKGVYDLAVVQSDWQYHAFHGTDIFEPVGAFPELRSLFSMHAEPLTVIARPGSGIRKFEDLRGKRVNLGKIGSGQRATMEVLLAALGWSQSDFAFAGQFSADEQGAALCDRRVDAIVTAVGHPNGGVLSITRSCDTLIIPVEGPEIAALIADHPYYAPATIPASIYRTNFRDTPTFGIRATVVATSNLPERAAYEATKAVFEGVATLREEHPAFVDLDPKEMATLGLAAPLHPGAARYYAEAGLR